eukprot:6225780-Prymnesium_polylepis.1
MHQGSLHRVTGREDKEGQSTSKRRIARVHLERSITRVVKKMTGKVNLAGPSKGTATNSGFERWQRPPGASGIVGKLGGHPMRYR